MKSLPRIASSSLVVIACASVVRAQTVLAFDGARCYSGAVEYWLTGSGMTQPYSQLLANGYTVQTTSQLSTAVLAGVDVFFSGGFQGGATLSPQEAADLQAWVNGGGSVLYVGEGDFLAPSNSQFVSLFGAGAYGGQDGNFNLTMTISAPAHPLISGPFGTVNSIGGMNICGRWINTPSSVTTVCTNQDGSGATLALNYGAGRVVLLNDVNYFCYPPAYTSDHAILWDNTIDWLASGGVCTGSPIAYCTPSTTTHGCNPSMSASGVPSAGASSGFVVTCNQVEGQRTGILFYGTSGPLALPWALGSSSFLCVKPPTQRTATQGSGGTVNQCDGTFTLDWLAFMAANPSALGNPLTPGQAFHVQAWFRDPPAVKTTNLSDGLTWTMCP